MMKLLKILCTLLGITAVSAGCIKEDMSGCPPEVNTYLTFSYRGDTDDPTMFRKMIGRVSLYVFDSASGQHILTKTVGEADLRLFEGTQLYLPEGNYRIVSWANAANNTEILVNGAWSQGRVHAPGYTARKRIATNDHLYYGELDITVPATAIQPGNNAIKVTGDIPHRSAHINIEIYTKGFGHKDKPVTWPVVEMAGLMPQYDMGMTPAQPFEATYYPTVAWDSEQNVAAARFSVLRFSDKNDITVTVREPAPDNTAKATVNLEKYMIDNNISVDGRNEATVRLLFEFTDLGVTVTIPGWTGGDVDPEI